MDWRDFFPLDSKPREGQKLAINAILEAFDAGKQNFVLEGPTGQGKSAIAVTVARYMLAKHHPFNVDTDEQYENGSYVLTTQKLLQQQYMRDFEKESRGGMLELKSATNYACGYDSRQSCGESKRALKALGKSVDGTTWKRHCTNHCVYNIAKREFLQGHLGVTNYSYFMTESTYSGKITPRELLIADECHNIEAEVTRLVEIEITERFCKKFLGINLSSYDDPSKLYEWVVKKYKPALKIVVEKTKNSLSVLNEGTVSNDEMFKSLIKQNDQLDKHVSKLERFIEQFDADSWVINRERRKDHRGERNSIQFKPIDATKWTEPYLLRFGKHRLMMSATILNSDAFCRSLGLDISKTASLALPSTFPVDNRRVHYVGVGSMGMRDIDDTLPKMAKAVKELLEVHSNAKGIIHTANFRVANYLRDNVRDKRLLCHASDDRDKVLKHHKTSKKPTVLLSPSMTEGVDLPDDLSRFQIIIKLPYPSLADKSLAKRIKRDPWYYDYLTARSFVQSLGRSVRHDKDHCVTYVLDGLFPMFMRKCSDTIPQYIKDAINM